MKYRKAEYIWIDGTKPTPLLRSKTKVVYEKESHSLASDRADNWPIWGFDGSSTQQAEGHASDCVLKPVFVCPSPVRDISKDVLVLCEVLLPDMSPHPSNTRHALAQAAAKVAEQKPWFGIEQEYNMYKDGRPFGFPADGFPRNQGPYYCGVGASDVFGRPLAEAHLTACLEAGLHIAGINGEVMPGQWEYQVGPIGAVEVSDELWVARWLLNRIGEDFGISVTIDPKPIRGNWNGAGAHTNFSTAAMRSSYDAVIAACEALKSRAGIHIANYGAGIEDRLTGEHETAPYSEFTYGVSNRGASVRIPWQVAKEKKGYLEDRRPNANCDPYTVTRLILETCCLGF